MNESGYPLALQLRLEALVGVEAPAAPLQRVGPSVRVIIHRPERSGNNAIGANKAEDGEVVVAMVVVVVGDERLHAGCDELEITGALHVRVIQVGKARTSDPGYLLFSDHVETGVHVLNHE